MPITFPEQTDDSKQNRNNRSFWTEFDRVNRLVVTAQTLAPGTGDDHTQGHAVGTIWVDETADDAYICLDHTSGAAVWKKITP